jgi:hypothetical protein
METPAAAPMGLACQSLLVRDDGGSLRHPFQYGGSRPTSTSELKHRISEVVSKADHAMLQEDSIDFGFISSHAASRVSRKAFVSYIEITVQIRAAFLSPLLIPSTPDGWDGKSLRKESAAFKA